MTGRGVGGTMAEEIKVDSEISAEALRKAEAYIEADEGAINRLSGIAGIAVTTVAVITSLFHLYAAVAGAWPQGLPHPVNMLRFWPGARGLRALF